MKQETAKQRYIRLLTPLAEADCPKFTGGSDFPLSDLMVLDELLRAGVIAGTRRGDEKNRPAEFYDVRITVQGRLFLEGIQKEEEAKTTVGFLKQNRWSIYKEAFKWVSGIAIGFCLKWLTEQFWPSTKP